MPCHLVSLADWKNLEWTIAAFWQATGPKTWPGEDSEEGLRRPTQNHEQKHRANYESKSSKCESDLLEHSLVIPLIATRQSSQESRDSSVTWGPGDLPATLAAQCHSANKPWHCLQQVCRPAPPHAASQTFCPLHLNVQPSAACWTTRVYLHHHMQPLRPSLSSI